MATLWDTPARFNHPNNIPKIETWAMAHFAKLFQVITIHNQLWPRCHFHDEYAATLKLFLSNDLTPFPINKPSLIVTLTRLNVSVKGCPLLPKVPITPQILPLFFWTSLSIMESFLETMASANSRILWSGLGTHEAQLYSPIPCYVLCTCTCHIIQGFLRVFFLDHPLLGQ